MFLNDPISYISLITGCCEERAVFLSTTSMHFEPYSVLIKFVAEAENTLTNWLLVSRVSQLVIESTKNHKM